MAGPTLLMCVGATKAGTTWLYDYLRKHPDCHLQPIKEIHYFDTRSGSSLKFYQEHAKKRLSELSDRYNKAGILKKRRFGQQVKSAKAWCDLLATQGEDHAKYMSYLNLGAGRAKLVADITPCYAILDRTAFAQMRDVAPDVRFLFLLRDPVDRAWSQARMNGRRRAVKYKRHTAEDASKLNFNRFLDGQEEMFALRSDYARTLEALTAEIPREQLYFEFYENLFTPDALARLTDYLGIAPRAGEFDKVSHAGSDQKLSATDIDRATDLLRDQYRFCAEFFDGQLPDRWRSRMGALQ